MAVLKKIKFGTGNATPIAQTVVTAPSESVISVVGTNTGLDDDENPSYAVDLNIDGTTLTKDASGQQAVLKVGTVPATQVSVDNSAAGITSTTAQAAFKELKEAIDNVDGAAKSYKIVSVANPASTSYAEYKIQQKVGESGDWGDVTDSAAIIVPKDNAFVTAQLGHTGATVNQTTGVITDGPTTGKEVLLIEYKNGEGIYILVEILVDDFLRESEFKNGLQVTNGIVSVKIDSTSETFLTVGKDGVKLTGVQDAINNAVAGLDVTDTAEPGQYVSQVSETDGKIAVERANVSDAVLNGYKKGEKPTSTAIATTDDVKGALAKLEHQVDAAKAAATTKVEKDNATTHLTLTSSTAADGSTTYTIGESDIASKTALDDEIAARKAVDGQDGQTYVANTGTNYISDATSLNNADVKLDAAIKAEAGRAKSAETSIDAAIGLTKGENNETRTYANAGEYIGKETSNTVASDIKALDTKLKEVANGLAAVQYKVNGTTLEFFGISENKTV